MAQDGTDWTEPGLFTVPPGVHRIPLPLPQDGLRAVNVYAIESGDDLVLIDGGWALADSGDLLATALGQIGRGPAEITRCLVTHVHRDHYTLGLQLRREFGSSVSLGLGERQAIVALSGGTAEPFAPQLAELRASGATGLIAGLGDIARALPGGAADWEEPDRWLTPYQEIGAGDRTLTVIPTPGHTRGHVVFRDAAAGLLFAGDHVLPHITPSIGFEAVPSPHPLQDFLSSLQLVRSLPDMRLLPAHGPVAPSAHARIDELFAHHDDRLARCLAAVQAGAATALEAARSLRWTRRQRQLDEMDPFNQMLAVIETRAHLELLTAQGRLVSSTQDGVVYYEVPGPPAG